jgi:hypothetical protein
LMILVMQTGLWLRMGGVLNAFYPFFHDVTSLSIPKNYVHMI